MQALKQPHNILSNMLFDVAIIPVITIHTSADAIPLATALAHGGAKIVEITLRTPCALDAINIIRDALPALIVAAGTVLTETQCSAAKKAGAHLGFSPATTSTLLAAARKHDFPFIPGVATCSDIAIAVEHQYEILKFFPAELNGGIAMLQTLASLFPSVQFCPTGGIKSNTANDYLKQTNVLCVGGSWMVTKTAVSSKNWDAITQAMKNALKPAHIRK